MTTSITDISGVGAITAEILKEQGYNTIEDLAAANVDDLAKLHGFGAVRAKQIIDLANNHLVAPPEQQDPVETAKESIPEKATPKPGKKKKADKNKKSSKKKDKKLKKEKKKEPKKKKGSKKKKSKK